MTYEDALAYLTALQTRGWRLGLDRMEEFVRRAGLSHAIGSAGPKYLHVAGTNGKGSVTAYIQSILRESGFRVGGFFSPFVYDVRERIQFDGEMIPKDDFTQLVERLQAAAESLEGTDLGGVTEFEFKTAMGFAYWEQACAEWVALEVGLGGRLDATNVVEPACSVIVSIGLDHTDILGNSIEEIAGEKAGIIKTGRPVVIGDLPPGAKQVVQEKSEQLGCDLWSFGDEFELCGPSSLGFGIRVGDRVIENLRTGMGGIHQPHNACVAVAAIEAAGLRPTPAAIREGLAKASLPGRLERRVVEGRELILDGAHNAESIQALVHSLECLAIEKPVVVFGMLTGHDPGPVCSVIDGYAAQVHLCPIDFRRTADPRELAHRFTAPTFVYSSSEAAIQAALLTRAGGPILVTGSFYLVGEVGRWLSDREHPQGRSK